MKYVDEYPDRKMADKLAAEIKRAVTRPWVIMRSAADRRTRL